MNSVGSGTGSIEINVVWQKSPKLNEEFNLAYGQSVTLQNTNLRIKFKEVLEDSRCPLNAMCVWAGNARIVLDVNGTLFELNTNLEPRAAFYAGYKITLIRLHPYPNVETMPIQPEEYSASLYVSAVDDIVMQGDIDTTIIGKTPAAIHDSITVSNGVLSMKVSYSGGCSEHIFDLYGLTGFLKSNQPQAEIFLSHQSSDPCEAWITTELRYNLLPLIAECKKQLGSGKILLRIYPPGSLAPVQPIVPLSF